MSFRKRTWNRTFARFLADRILARYIQYGLKIIVVRNENGRFVVVSWHKRFDIGDQLEKPIEEAIVEFERETNYLPIEVSRDKSVSSILIREKQWVPSEA
jgi:hypothetical protein